MTKPTGRKRGRPSNAEKAEHAARQPATTLGVQARYDAGGTGRRMAGWNPMSSGPNASLNRVDKLRSRQRDSTRNDWSGESAIQKWATNLVGVGIQAREKVKNPKREALWGRWGGYCDADGMLDIYGQQTLGVREWFDGGEYFLRKRVRRSDSPLEVPLQIQMLEAEMLPRWDTDYAQFLPANNKIRSGIELDRSGQRVAYWFFKEHPGDFGGTGGYIVDASSLVRVPASEIRHVFEVKRAGQLRGVPNGANVLARLRTLLDYDDAVLERQKLANLFVAFIKRDLPEGIDPTIDPASGQTIESDEDGNPMIPMEPGMLQELRQGESMEFSNPPEAGTVFSDYMRTQQLGVAAGQGLPYELYSGDILNISDRTLRIVVQEFRRFCEQRQWQVIIPMHCQTTRDWFVEIATLAGKLATSQVDEAKSVLWVPHGWSYIHPVQDATGKALELANGVISRSKWITERGDDPEQVDDERKSDIDRGKKLGLPIPEEAKQPAAPSPGSTPPPGQ